MDSPFLTTRLYIKVSDNVYWDIDGALTNVWFFGSPNSGEYPDVMKPTTKVADGVYVCDIPEGGYTSFKIARCNPNPGNDGNGNPIDPISWAAKWDESQNNLSINGTANYVNLYSDYGIDYIGIYPVS
jgi:hypothetical protein